MFVIGNSMTIVVNDKVTLPTAYHLKKKRILAKWKDKNTLYLSDSDKSLNYIAGKDTALFTLEVDTDDRISVPKEYNRYMVEISGCVSTIELVFRP